MGRLLEVRAGRGPGPLRAYPSPRFRREPAPRRPGSPPGDGASA